ncbi:serine O-acetyltransferase [Photobacterium damselae]|uniref:Serine acetyltransferase n=2 Tax=Gammaproteobacteria TaxID=1236 RepID=A0A4S2JG56_PHODD|nr:serine acetyltransferase [Photobacterium damselae]EHA1082319.1 serine acetyltransferase [Photobacterium damselae]KAB1183741.1 serine acetyltransferase [Photobacterium damselae subsp. damselae]MBF7101458.1 serine acetyltransferase [Photobacterium damselae]MCG3812455.1 serine acetyltransferase [Photobacterium damselae]NVO62735.1 serine acetyltransferase [Photobacterium damselae subsp. damselae]
MIGLIRNELSINSSLTAKLFIINFRLASLFYSSSLINKVFIVNVLFLKLLKFICGLDIPPRTKIGEGMILYHPQNIVINADSVLGRNVMLKHNVTIGNKIDPITGKHVSPVIGNNVELSPGVIVLGGISVGDNSIIGAGSIVVKNIPANSIAVGSPAKVIKKISEG